MTDLEDALNLVDADTSDNGTPGLFEARTLVLEAARKWLEWERGREKAQALLDSHNITIDVVIVDTT